MLYLLLIIAIASVLLSQVRFDKPFEALATLYTDRQSCFYDWKGIRVHFKDEGHGIPVIFLHGTSSSLHTWDKLASSQDRDLRKNGLGLFPSQLREVPMFSCPASS